MGADFYQDDYGGDYYGGYGGSGAEDYVDIGAGDGFNYGYGFDGGGGGAYYQPTDIGAGDGFNYGYGFDTGLYQGPVGGSDLYGDFLSYWLEQGLDFETASQFAAEDAGAGSIYTPTYEQGAPVTLPDIGSPSVPINYFDYDPWRSPPYVPSFPDLPTPQAPAEPAPAQAHLPPACAGGTYHPYPIGHPQQDVCVPFPPQTQQQQQQQRPSAPSSSSGGSSGGSKPQQQQQCPPNQTRDPITGQCRPIQQQCPNGYYRAANGQCLPIPRCTTPGTVFDQARGICVPQGQAMAPASGEAGDLLSSFKDIPWWVYVAAGGLLLLSRGDDGKTTTVRYRRAT